jgi:hypothetical protein
MSPEFRMRPMYELLLHGTERMSIGLYQLYLATPDQLTRLHYSPGSLKAVKKRLKTLVDEGYVQVDAVGVKHRTDEKTFFSARYYYTLGSAGMRYLEALGLDVHEAWRAQREVDKHGLFVNHTLELNDVIIAAALLARTDPRFQLAAFIHERTLRRRPYKVKGGDGQPLTLIPDAFLDFRLTGSRLQFPVLLEHDRGTEEQVHFKRKVRAYLSLLKTEAYRELFGTQSVSVAFTTFQGEKRLEQIREWIRQVLVANGEPWQIGSAFYFAALPQPLFPGVAWLEPRWRSPYDTQPQPLLVA